MGAPNPQLANTQTASETAETAQGTISTITKKDGVKHSDNLVYTGGLFYTVDDRQ